MAAPAQDRYNFTIKLACMTKIAERTVLFADLRGSTALYETLGNAEATSVVTHTVASLGRAVPACGGEVIKTLGDGLMAVFDSPADGFQSAQQMHEALELLVKIEGSQFGASSYNGNISLTSDPLTPVPLPAALPLMLAGLGLFGFASNRRVV